MTKILSIIIIIIIIATGGWYYKNNMKTPSEGTAIGYESGRGGDKDKNGKENKEDRYDNKFDNKSFVVTFPNASSTLMVGEKVNTTWNTGLNFNLKLTYPVILVSVTDKTKKPVDLGTAKYSLLNRVFTWTVPATTTPGTYKLVFGGKQGGESQGFVIATPTKVIIPTVEKLFSNINTINPKDPYNYDNLAGIKVDIGLNITSKGGDIYASGTTAVVGIKDKETGQIIATTTVNVTTSESGLNIFQEGATKVVYISTVFGTSTLPLKNMIVSSFVQSITFYPVVKDPSLNRYTLDYGLESLISDNFVTIIR